MKMSSWVFVPTLIPYILKLRNITIGISILMIGYFHLSDISFSSI